MLSIAKLRVGQEAYQLSGIAQSLDDYYTGRGEADGLWMGVGGERSRWSMAEISERNHASHLGLSDGGVRSAGKPVVHQAGFVGFDVTDARPTQRLGRDDPRDGVDHEPSNTTPKTA